MCLTTTVIVSILGFIAALKYKIIRLCPSKPPRFEEGGSVTDGPVVGEEGEEERTKDE